MTAIIPIPFLQSKPANADIMKENKCNRLHIKSSSQISLPHGFKPILMQHTRNQKKPSHYINGISMQPPQ